MIRVRFYFLSFAGLTEGNGEGNWAVNLRGTNWQREQLREGAREEVLSPIGGPPNGSVAGNRTRGMEICRVDCKTANVLFVCRKRESGGPIRQYPWVHAGAPDHPSATQWDAGSTRGPPGHPPATPRDTRSNWGPYACHRPLPLTGVHLEGSIGVLFG